VTRRENPVEEFALLPAGQREDVLNRMPISHRRELVDRWIEWAHEGQTEPEGSWRIWLIRAGRGFGKTRAGAEWITEFARDHGDARIALVGGTAEDVRRVMIEGASGLLAVARDDEVPRWRATVGEVIFHSGARAFVYSAEAPEALRGPEHHVAWCDELAKWRGASGEAAWDNLMLGLRLGELPRVIVTTTPRPVKLMRRVMALPGVEETRGRTRDNPHLPASFVEAMLEHYAAGSRIARQELDGELIDQVEGALWTRALLEARRVRRKPAMRRVVVGVDPPAGVDGDACGIVAVGLGVDGHAYVLEDASVAGVSPERWARAVARCAARRKADRVVAEANQGGAMVRSVLSAADQRLPVRLVHARQGKAARAEPVAALYEGARAWHVGGFAALEDEMCGLQAGGGYQGPGRSPDRADALVWAMTELMLRRYLPARVVGL